MPWEPLNADHAIEQVVVTIGFKEAITLKLLQSIIDRRRADVAKAGLSTNVELKGVQFAIGAQAAPVMEQNPNPAGFGFRKQSSTTISEELFIVPSELKYTSRVYKRWTDFRARFFELADPFLREVLTSVDISEVKMEYVDQFINAEPNPSAAELFKPDSQYLPKFVSTERGSFHAHLGRFLKFEEANRRLFNVNIDVADTANPPKRVARILSLGQDTTGSSLPLAGDVLVRLDELHDVLKVALADIISEKAAHRISLTAVA